MEGIKNMVSLLWQDLINLIHLNPKKEGSTEIIDFSKQLSKDGIIKIPNFIDTDLADSIREQIETLAEQNPRSTQLPNGTNFNYRNQDNPEKSDHGMLDIAYVQNSIPDIAQIDQSDLIQVLKNISGQEIIPLKVNAYLNRGIKNTRMYHVDNTQPVIYKAFIYLSDVPNTDFGPYSFVKKSHRFSFLIYLNLLLNMFSSKLNSTDMPRYNKGQVMHAIGKKGDLIMSNQNGIHRGIPQKEGNKRVVLVLSFMVKSKLSYIHKAAKVNIAKSKDYALQGQK